MNNRDISLNGYLENPLAIQLDFCVNSDLAIDELKKLASRTYDFPILRWRLIKKINKLLISEKVFPDFTIYLTKSLTPKAYMKDCGEIYISLGALLFRSSLVTLKVLCHELSHLWLSNQPFYGRLKSVDKEFKQKYSDIDFSKNDNAKTKYDDNLKPSGKNRSSGRKKDRLNAYLLSPIEVYAMIVSVSLMELIDSRITKKRSQIRWQAVIEEERSKLSRILSTLKTLSTD